MPKLFTSLFILLGVFLSFTQTTPVQAAIAPDKIEIGPIELDQPGSMQDTPMEFQVTITTYPDTIANTPLETKTFKFDGNGNVSFPSGYTPAQIPCPNRGKKGPCLGVFEMARNKNGITAVKLSGFRVFVNGREDPAPGIKPDINSDKPCDSPNWEPCRRDANEQTKWITAQYTPGIAAYGTPQIDIQPQPSTSIDKGIDPSITITLTDPKPSKYTVTVGPQIGLDQNAAPPKETILVNTCTSSNCLISRIGALSDVYITNPSATENQLTFKVPSKNLGEGRRHMVTVKIDNQDYGAEFGIKNTPGIDKLNVIISPTQFTNQATSKGKAITATITNATNSKYRIYIKNIDNTEPAKGRNDFNCRPAGSEFKCSKDYTLPNDGLPGGDPLVTYYMVISLADDPSTYSERPFTIGPTPKNGGGSGGGGGVTKCDPTQQDCTSSGGIHCDTSDGATARTRNIKFEKDFIESLPAGNVGILTAIGCVPTDPQKLIQGLFRVGIGLGGAAALLLMIGGAFQFITSAGNPDAVKSASETFTQAIIGLLVIIFAVLLLQIIGVDILNIPGFNK